MLACFALLAARMGMDGWGRGVFFSFVLLLVGLLGKLDGLGLWRLFFFGGAVGTVDIGRGG